MNAFATSSRRLALAVLASMTLVPAAMAETAPMRAGGPAPAAPAAAPAPAATITRGKVLETMNAGNYTYVRAQTDSGEKWVAGPEAKVKVGDAVEWPGGMEMKNFTSKTMGRTFESILFVDRIGPASAPGAAAAAGAASPHGAGGTPHAALSGKAAAPAEVKGIAKAAGGITVAEAYDRRAEFDGKEVTLRGKVVKFNASVMDRNWIHLQDGTTASTGQNDLTVTSDGTAAVGDTVLVKGKLVLNRDFGFNYRYDVMVEGAAVTKE